MVDYEAVRNEVERNRSYTMTAYKFAISKQRVYQIIQDEYPELHKQLTKKPIRCDSCKQLKRYTVTRLAGRFCKDCVRKAVKQWKKEHWARKYDNCIQCGTIKVEHHSKGLCLNCHAKKMYQRKHENNLSNTNP